MFLLPQIIDILHINISHKTLQYWQSARSVDWKKGQPLHWFPRANEAKYHKPGSLKQPKTYCLRVLDARVWNQGLVRPSSEISRVTSFRLLGFVSIFSIPRTSAAAFQSLPLLRGVLHLRVSVTLVFLDTHHPSAVWPHLT